MNRKAYNMKIYLHIFLIGIIIELCIYDMIPRSFSEIAYPAWTNTYFIIWFVYILKTLHEIKKENQSDEKE